MARKIPVSDDFASIWNAIGRVMVAMHLESPMLEKRCDVLWLETVERWATRLLVREAGHAAGICGPFVMPDRPRACTSAELAEEMEGRGNRASDDPEVDELRLQVRAVLNVLRQLAVEFDREQ